MPEAGTDMNMDRLFELKTSASIGTENIPPPSLSSAPSGDILRNFYHTKRVGNYLIGRKLGEGSFAKVREGLHALTGEKVPSLTLLLTEPPLIPVTIVTVLFEP